MRFKDGDSGEAGNIDREIKNVLDKKVLQMTFHERALGVRSFPSEH